MAEVLLSFHLFTLFRKGTSMETNRTTSRRALALIQIWASEASLPLSHVRSSLSRLTPVSRRYRVTPTERARKVLLPWSLGLTVLWSLVRPIVSWLSRLSLNNYQLSIQLLSIQPILPPKGRPIHPPDESRGLSGPFTVKAMSRSTNKARVRYRPPPWA